MSSNEVKETLNRIAEHLESASGLILHVADKTVEVLDAVAEVFADESLDEDATPQGESDTPQTESKIWTHPLTIPYMVDYIRLATSKHSWEYLEYLGENNRELLRELYKSAWEAAGRVGIDHLRYSNR